MTNERVDNMKFAISALMERAEIPRHIIDQMLVPEGMEIIETAFRHESFDRENNYELQEFIGDNIVNLYVATYVSEKYASMVEVGALTILKHRLQSNKELGLLVERLGFISFLLISQEEELTVKIKGDVFEGFIGSLLFTAIQVKKCHSTGLLICQKIIYYLLDKLKIDANNPETWKDPVSAFKENYLDAQGWGKTKDFIKEVKVEGKESIFKVYGLVKGKKYLLAQGPTKADAAREAMRVLREKYGNPGKSK